MTFNQKNFRNQRKIKNKRTKTSAARKKNCHVLKSKNGPSPTAAGTEKTGWKITAMWIIPLYQKRGVTCTATCQHKRAQSKIESALHFKNTPSGNLPICSPYF